MNIEADGPTGKNKCCKQTNKQTKDTKVGILNEFPLAVACLSPFKLSLSIPHRYFLYSWQMKESDVFQELYFWEVENVLGPVQWITLIFFILCHLVTTKQFQFSTWLPLFTHEGFPFRSYALLSSFLYNYTSASGFLWRDKSSFWDWTRWLDPHHSRGMMDWTAGVLECWRTVRFRDLGRESGSQSGATEFGQWRAEAADGMSISHVPKQPFDPSN